MSADTSSITCPECGTLNRPSSVFCAECGAMLPHPDADADPNATASFMPVSTDEHDRETWDASDTQTTQIFTPRVEYDAPLPAPVAESPWTPSYTGHANYVPDPGRRGFVLGIIASILILIVFGFFLWSTVASEGFRDSITGLF